MSQTRIGMKQNEEQRKKSPTMKAFVWEPNIDRGSIHEYINKKRELFLMEYSLDVKKREILLLEQMAEEEEKKLTKAEKLLEEDAILFEEFLKENDKNALEAIRLAEQETKIKLEKVAEIKKVNSKIVAIKSEISKYEDTLKDYKKYKEFLLMLSPPQWKEKQRPQSTVSSDVKPTEKSREKKRGPSDRKRGEIPVSRGVSSVQEVRISSSKSLKTSSESSTLNRFTTGTDSSDFEEDLEIFFKDPQELLDLMTELEEQNLSIIQNTRETEEALEEFRQNDELTRQNMESESKQLTEQIDFMREAIEREKEKTAELERKAKHFSFGLYKPEDQEQSFDSLRCKVEEVYHCCVGETEAKLSTLQMLIAIEEKLGQLLENAELIPKDIMSIAERAKEKQRRMRQAPHQNIKNFLHLLRLKHLLLCLDYAVKKLMPRSQPPVRKCKTSKEKETIKQKNEDLLNFFS
ncbi:hypothetical protein DNTS_011622 [Danionella cerebrum]|nr:hypothetical protein DNTS_011622 [Danionella translucida]